jgi:hypothetical protein
MSRVAQLAVTVGLMAVLLSACGISAKPQAGTPNLSESHNFYGVVDEPWTSQANCLSNAHLKFHEYLTPGQHLPAIQIGSLPTGPTMVFESTPGIAQGIQIQGGGQGAEAIGAKLLYPNQASNNVLTVAEGCASIGVSG